MKEYITQSAVLLCAYKRIDTTMKVFDVIKSVKPTRIYIAQNYYKNLDEREDVFNLRKTLLSNINWECEVKTLFRDHYLNSKQSLISAITWFFENEEQGIILEDDCLPNMSFFRFCDENLKIYKDIEIIKMVSGWSALDFVPHTKESLKEDYYFSKYNHIWGWASWSRVWKQYVSAFDDFEKEFNALDNWANTKERNYWHKTFLMAKNGAVDSWDYYFTYSIWKHNGLCIYPKNNMVQNIGFNRDDATHTKGDSKFARMNVYELEFPLRIPSAIQQNKKLDWIAFKISYLPPNIFIRICKKILKILKSTLK